PFAVRPAVDAGRRGEREHVEHVLAFARLVRRAEVAALAPAFGGPQARVAGEGVARQAAQEIDARLLRALLVLDARDQVFQLLGIARVAGALGVVVLVPSLLVGVVGCEVLAVRALMVLLTHGWA